MSVPLVSLLLKELRRYSFHRQLMITQITWRRNLLQQSLKWKTFVWHHHSQWNNEIGIKVKFILRGGVNWLANATVLLPPFFVKGIIGI